MASTDAVSIARAWAYLPAARLYLTWDDVHGLAKSFAITSFSELGDKTFLTCAILAMRHSPTTVFWGCWSAMICMSTLSSFLGAIVPALLSQRMAHWISAALFMGFGLVALYQGLRMTGHEMNEEWKEAEDDIGANEEAHELERLERADSEDVASQHPETSRRSSALDGARNLCGLLVNPVFSQAFVLSFLGEWGDRSQITTMALAATHRVAIVAIGTSLAHLACIAVAVAAGALLARRLSPRHLTLGGAVLFLLFGLMAGYEALYEPPLHVPRPSAERTSSTSSM
ncbi:GCR1-dependent translation factor 1 [Malassezia equina]|uniref:GDT1 family protein n=1 Tax=Malassezia equina TaxID=1381935 RepID=A0AAF0EFN3_9BASI|nr:GCR1-dependent translation factor 1 [Malassezia equina]